MSDKIKFLVCGNVKAPQRKAGQDAGFDFFVPEYSPEFVEQLRACNDTTIEIDRFECDGSFYIVLCPGEDVKIPSLVRAYIPSDQCLLLVNKSGVSLKQKLAVGACLVDSSYEGIIHLHMFNMGNHTTYIKFGQKLVQAVPYLINNQESEIFYETDISKEEFYKDHDHVRGDGGFGSTGLK